jgi:hypothetical protein
MPAPFRIADVHVATSTYVTLDLFRVPKGFALLIRQLAWRNQDRNTLQGVFLIYRQEQTIAIGGDRQAYNNPPALTTNYAWLYADDVLRFYLSGVTIGDDIEIYVSGMLYEISEGGQIDLPA